MLTNLDENNEMIFYKSNYVDLVNSLNESEVYRVTGETTKYIKEERENERTDEEIMTRSGRS